VNVYTFLAALPALLAIGGFVVYQLIGTHKGSNEITKQIVAKLRNASPEQVEQLQGLTGPQIAEKLRLDHELRASVGEQDFQLLQSVVRQEFVKSLVVYALVAVLFIASVAAYVYLQTRPQTADLRSWQIESDNAGAKGLAVDLDPLVLTWQASGPSQSLDVYLENVQTQRRSNILHTMTGEQRLLFSREDYLPLLAKRGYGEVNRIRAAARTKDQSFTSPEFDLHVGITVMSLPDQERRQVMIFAVIDNTRLDGYSFEAKVLVWRTPATLGPETFGGQITESRGNFPVPDYESVRWDTATLTYLGPDDLRLVRTVTK
jgi:hypothetical protein